MTNSGNVFKNMCIVGLCLLLLNIIPNGAMATTTSNETNGWIDEFLDDSKIESMTNLSIDNGSIQFYKIENVTVNNETANTTGDEKIIKPLEASVSDRTILVGVLVSKLIDVPKGTIFDIHYNALNFITIYMEILDSKNKTILSNVSFGQDLSKLKNEKIRLKATIWGIEQNVPLIYSWGIIPRNEYVLHEEDRLENVLINKMNNELTGGFTLLSTHSYLDQPNRGIYYVSFRNLAYSISYVPTYSQWSSGDGYISNLQYLYSDQSVVLGDANYIDSYWRWWYLYPWDSWNKQNTLSMTAHLENHIIPYNSFKNMVFGIGYQPSESQKNLGNELIGQLQFDAYPNTAGLLSTLYSYWNWWYQYPGDSWNKQYTLQYTLSLQTLIIANTDGDSFIDGKDKAPLEWTRKFALVVGVTDFDFWMEWFGYRDLPAWEPEDVRDELVSLGYIVQSLIGHVTFNDFSNEINSMVSDYNINNNDVVAVYISTHGSDIYGYKIAFSNDIYLGSDWGGVPGIRQKLDNFGSALDFLILDTCEAWTFSSEGSFDALANDVGNIFFLGCDGICDATTSDMTQIVNAANSNTPIDDPQVLTNIRTQTGDDWKSNDRYTTNFFLI